MIEKLRIRKKNELNVKIKELKTSVQRIINAIENYRKNGINSEVNILEINIEIIENDKQKRISEYEKQIQEKQLSIQNLEEIINRIDTGEMDNELESELVIIKPARKTEKEVKKETKKETEIKNEGMKNDKKKYKKDTVVEDVKNYAKSKEMNAERIRQMYLREWNSYIFSQNSLPEYMKKNLKEMNQNKGYIWKGCWFMGQIDCNDEDVITMFEKPSKESLFIHEYNKEKRVYSLYEKSGQNYKKLILKRSF